ncbi:unnamed protein product, partial [marine sediment metagenome]
AVANWKAWGRFPDYLHMRIWVAANERSIKIAPSLVGISADAPPLEAAE